jgi:hypothetical protein
MSEYTAKISREGTLFIKRGKELREQLCPYAQPRISSRSPLQGGVPIIVPAPCGDHCPSFAGPWNRKLKESEVDVIQLQICSGNLVFEDIIDETEMEEEDGNLET